MRAVRPGAVDPAAATGAGLAPSEFAWTPDSVALYHLGIGAGAAEPSSDLDLLLEDRLRPLPSFATLSCFPALIHLDEVPGLAAIDLPRVLHGEHRVELSCPIPASGRVHTVGAIEAVEDKGGNALLTIRQESRWPDGSPAWVNRYKMVARGVGAFAGTPPAPEPVAPATKPIGDPDYVVAIPTSPQQAALYRHSGDDNPLHLDPEYARAGGFDTPILQGLAYLGFAVRVGVRDLLDGSAEQVAGLAVRFAGVVIPGETLVISYWRVATGIEFAAEVESGGSVMRRGLIYLRDPTGPAL